MKILKERQMSIRDMIRLERLEAESAEMKKIIKGMADKVGYNLVEIGETEAGSKIFEYENDDSEIPTGDYLNPVQIPVDGTTIEAGKWYYVDDKELPHEAKLNAFITIEDFNDRTWFDFV